MCPRSIACLFAFRDSSGIESDVQRIKSLNGFRIAIATLGGPTAVLNATVQGFVDGAGDSGDVAGVCGGPEGLAAGQLCDLGSGGGFGVIEAGRPGSWLGAGRHLLTDEAIDNGLRRLAAQGVRGLAVVGGNGTMACCQRLTQWAERNGLPIGVVGVPKTIDNDLCGMDHSPGFLSAATFVIETVADLSFDHRAMRSIEQVRIVETLGRNSGWLALASLLARRATGAEPHLVYIPERPFDESAFLEDVQRQVATTGRALVVVAEGAAGNLVGDRFEKTSFERPIEGGVARVLADRVRDALALTVRAEIPGLVQRCSTRHVSPRDRVEAFAVGQEAARLLALGKTGVMVTLGLEGLRGATDDTVIAESSVVSLGADVGNVSLGRVALAAVAGGTRRIPPEWVPTSAAGDSKGFETWLQELLSPG